MALCNECNDMQYDNKRNTSTGKRVVGRPLSLCAHAKCDLFQVVVLVILMFTRQLAQSGFECLIGSTINPDGQWLTIL